MIEIELMKVTDIEAVNSLYHDEYRRHRSTSQFRWEFLDGPAGPAVYVIARDSATKEIIGTVCAIPYQFQNDRSEKFLTGKVEDLLIKKNYRGRKIFEQMYAFLEIQAKQRGLAILWAFTYADKSFLQLGFLSPFKANLGFKFFRWLPSIQYLLANRKITAKHLINTIGLVSLSKLMAMFKSFEQTDLGAFRMFEQKSENLVELMKQLHTTTKGHYSIYQDRHFLNWRIYQNPYTDFIEHVLKNDKGAKVGSIIYTVSNEVANLIQQVIDPSVPEEVKRGFIKLSTQQLSDTNHFIKFWGFTHNPISVEEIDLMKSAGILFTGTGIPFVWKNIGSGIHLPNDILLSRMASQGTS